MNPTPKTLIDIKNNLSKDHWEAFADLEKLQEQTGKDRALSQSDRKELNNKLTAALHLQGVVQTTYKSQQKELGQSSNKFEQFVSSFKNKFSKKQEKPPTPITEIKPKATPPIETKSEPDRRAGRRFS